MIDQHLVILAEQFLLYTRSKFYCPKRLGTNLCFGFMLLFLLKGSACFMLQICCSYRYYRADAIARFVLLFLFHFLCKGDSEMNSLAH